MYVGLNLLLRSFRIMYFGFQPFLSLLCCLVIIIAASSSVITYLLVRRNRQRNLP